MKNTESKNYEPPMIDVIEVEVENGFAASDVEGDAVGNINDMPWG